MRSNCKLKLKHWKTEIKKEISSIYTRKTWKKKLKIKKKKIQIRRKLFKKIWKWFWFYLMFWSFFQLLLSGVNTSVQRFWKPALLENYFFYTKKHFKNLLRLKAVHGEFQVLKIRFCWNYFGWIQFDGGLIFVFCILSSTLSCGPYYQWINLSFCTFVFWFRGLNIVNLKIKRM